jgi:HSP20 family protein
MALSYLSPLSEIRNEIDRVFSDFTEDLRLPSPFRGETTGLGIVHLPPIEVSETNKDVIVCASLPGIDPKDINVEIMGNSLILSGECQRETKKEDQKVHRSEFHYGTFMRRITLPDYVKGDAAQAEYKNGVLELRIPKMEEAKRKRIEIKKSS